MQAVQDAYDQALTGRQAILRGGCTFTDSDGKRVRLPDEIDEVYILCVTGDHYPAVIPQARTFLRKGDEDPDPIMMSVFDLDVVSHYLRDRFDFLYYVRQRSDHVAYFFADSELALLGFHLRHKLFPDDEYGGTLIDQSYSQLVDANFLVSRGNWPDAPAAQRLFHEWKNPQFDQLIHDIKLAAARQRDPPSVSRRRAVFPVRPSGERRRPIHQHGATTEAGHPSGRRDARCPVADARESARDHHREFPRTDPPFA